MSEIFRMLRPQPRPEPALQSEPKVRDTKDIEIEGELDFGKMLDDYETSTTTEESGDFEIEFDGVFKTEDDETKPSKTTKKPKTTTEKPINAEINIEALTENDHEKIEATTIEKPKPLQVNLFADFKPQKKIKDKPTTTTTEKPTTSATEKAPKEINLNINIETEGTTAKPATTAKSEAININVQASLNSNEGTVESTTNAPVDPVVNLEANAEASVDITGESAEATSTNAAETGPATQTETTADPATPAAAAEETTVPATTASAETESLSEATTATVPVSATSTSTQETTAPAEATEEPSTEASPPPAVGAAPASQ